ncbi:MAG TPA: argininosuccinate lyase [Blastocatellia bacterium]|nr:argininosuccinate lyase [Blastocatellia bacterium]
MKLWGGRFKGEANASFARFNASFSFDKRLIEADVTGSRAYAKALAAAGILTADEASIIDTGLNQILQRAYLDATYLESATAEDVHSFVETELVGIIGNPGYKLHTGRSRNDQVATDLRLFLRGEIDRTADLIVGLQQAIIRVAEANKDVVMPGYTHLQRAQAVLFAHYALAYFEMFGRDRTRLSDLRRRTNILPLGSGALAGAGFKIDRESLARSLGFDGVCRNSLDAVSDRDFVIEFISSAAVSMMHLSRLSEDLILYSTSEFGFIELSDSVSTGSSLMPQKKNPDSLELIRGKSGRVFGHLTGLLSVMKGLPLAYDKDMQEDKEALFDTIDTLGGSLEVMTLVLDNIRLNGQHMADAAESGYANATDLADYLVGRGLEFRRAHEVVGRIVSHAITLNKKLEELPLADYLMFSELFGEDLYSSLTLEASLSHKSATGGTAPGRVAEALAQARAEMEQLKRLPSSA